LCDLDIVVLSINPARFDASPLDEFRSQRLKIGCHGSFVPSAR
jgi:hypothetical protein